MSRRAIVAYPTGYDNYNLHYSHNGADRLQLKPLIENAIKKGKDPKLSDADAYLKPSAQVYVELQETFGLNDDTKLKPRYSENLIEEGPFQMAVHESQFGEHIEFDHIEALYVVDGSDNGDKTSPVTTYVPAWTEPNVIQLLRQCIDSIDVYDYKEVPVDKSQWNPSESNHDPVYSITNSQLTHENLSENNRHKNLIKEHHMDILAMHIAMVKELRRHKQTIEESGQTPQTVLEVGRDVMVLKATQINETVYDSTNQGAFVRVKPQTEEQSYTSRYLNIRDTLADLRFSRGMALDEHDSPSEKQRKRQERKLVVDLLKEFDINVAPFSPTNRSVIHQFREKLAENVEQTKSV